MHNMPIIIFSQIYELPIVRNVIFFYCKNNVIDRTHAIFINLKILLVFVGCNAEIQKNEMRQSHDL